MHHPLGNAFSVKMSHLFQIIGVLHQHGTIASHGEGMVVILGQSSLVVGDAAILSAGLGSRPLGQWRVMLHLLALFRGHWLAARRARAGTAGRTGMLRTFRTLRHFWLFRLRRTLRAFRAFRHFWLFRFLRNFRHLWLLRRLRLFWKHRIFRRFRNGGFLRSHGIGGTGFFLPLFSPGHGLLPGPGMPGLLLPPLIVLERSSHSDRRIIAMPRPWADRLISPPCTLGALSPGRAAIGKHPVIGHFLSHDHTSLF